MESDSTDFDSIDFHSDKEMREAEETVLHHLSYCTRFKISEQQLSTVLRNLLYCPSTILTPFVLSSVLSMTKINRDPDTPLVSSVLLPLLRNLISNNEDEKEMCKLSAWVRDTLQTKEVDLEQIFTILIDQNKDGKDVVTPGLVNLAFILLKAKNSQKLNALAITFLQKFIKKRFIFGQGIVKILAEWMILEQDETQYSECLTILSLTDTFTISECVKTIKYVLDFFLWIPGNNAMRMMSFILPIVKISHTIRDALIDLLKKAMYSFNLQTCRMGVHGFCMLLKLLRNNNSQRSSTNKCGILTQQSISGYSLMSQLTLGNKNNPQRHFDMLALEIIGLLRAVFTKPLAIKQTLYEDLTRAVEFNPKLAPHVLQFIERYFRSYFNVNSTNNDNNYDDSDDDNDENECEIKFDKIIRKRNENENEIEILEDLGHLTMFVADCVIICNKHEQLNYEPFVLRKLFKQLIDDMTHRKNVESFEFKEPLTHEGNQIALQVIGLIEGLMYYALWTSEVNDDNCENILKLFKLHRAIREKIKSLSVATNKKQIKKSKNTNDTNDGGPTQHNFTINGTIVKKLNFKPENIWDLPTLERFQRLLHDHTVSFATSESTSKLRSNRDLVCYVLTVTITHIEMLRSQPDYKQIAHSKRVLQNLIDLTKLIYERCIKRLSELWSNFDVEAAYLCVECLKQSLITANVIFKRKFIDYINQVDFHTLHVSESKAITTILQDTIEAAIRDEDELSDTVNGKKIPFVLLQCLEVLYENLSFDDPSTMESYSWLLKFCQTHELQNKDLGLVYKLLFNQRHKTHSGIFYYSIALQIENVCGQIDEEVKIQSQFEFKSITEATVEICTTHLLSIIRRQIEEIEYFIGKCKSTCVKLKMTTNNEQDILIETLKSMERSISSKLLHIFETVVRLTNACLPLGSNMDNLMRILLQYYICVTNLTKHFIIRHATIPVSFQGVKFDQVVKVSGKPLAKRIYNLITYIEQNMFEANTKQRKKNDPLADKAKVLRDAKFIPKLILRIENFNKFVMLLSKKTKNDYFSHYLHMGTVRDFRIQTSELKKVINETLTHSSQIQCDESMIEEIDQLSDGEKDGNDDNGDDGNDDGNEDGNDDGGDDGNGNVGDDDNGGGNIDSTDGKEKHHNNESDKNVEEEIEINQDENDTNNVKRKIKAKKENRQQKTKEKKKEVSDKKTKESNKKIRVLVETLPVKLSLKTIPDINVPEPLLSQSSGENDIIRIDEKRTNTESQILKNLDVINKRSRKRKTIAEKKKQQEEEPQPKKRNRRKPKNSA